MAKANTKALFLYTSPASYLSRCLMHLNLQPLTEIHIVYKKLNYKRPDFHFKENSIAHSIKPPNFQELLRISLNFEPTIIFISGWIDNDYLRIGAFFKKQGISVIGLSDTPFQNSIRQYLGKWYARRYLKNIFSAFWVAGNTAEQLIRYLGWTNLPVFHGFYTADHQIFFPLLVRSNIPSFLFVGRLEKSKGIENLIAAYQYYHATVQNPWKLMVVGTGSLHKKLPNSDGIQYLGYLANRELGALYRRATCFILPSSFEPWGVVIQEAAASGLPLILSQNCGASEKFFLPEVNGWLWKNGGVRNLAALMTKVHFTPLSELNQFGKKSQELSWNLSIQHWLKTFAAIKSL